MSLLNELVVQRKDELDWSYLSYNPSTVPFLRENVNKIDWCFLSYNPGAIHFIEEILNTMEFDSFVNWKGLSQNPAAIHLLEREPDKIVWSNFSRNEKAPLSSLSYLEEMTIKLFGDYFQSQYMLFLI